MTSKKNKSNIPSLVPFSPNSTLPAEQLLLGIWHNPTNTKPSNHIPP